MRINIFSRASAGFPVCGRASAHELHGLKPYLTLYKPAEARLKKEIKGALVPPPEGGGKQQLWSSTKSIKENQSEGKNKRLFKYGA